jgi:AraC-like DNA-binding protein
METHIVHIRHPALKAYIQYFIFFTQETVDRFSYQTFPNTNLCLAIYKDNNVTYKRSDRENLCTIAPGNSRISSRLFGFHQQPFKVDINSNLDQICILFHPGGLRAITKSPYGELVKEESVFECIFGNHRCFLEDIFERSDPYERGTLLEDFLSKRIAAHDNLRTHLLLHHIYKLKGSVSVQDLSRSLKINESTLYRSFIASLGQSPKDFIQTVRFRNALSLMLEQQYRNLTELTYTAMFYDQSHFIKDFKKRSGSLPNSLYKNMQLEQRLLAWVVKPV